MSLLRSSSNNTQSPTSHKHRNRTVTGKRRHRRCCYWRSETMSLVLFLTVSLLFGGTTMTMTLAQSSSEPEQDSSGTTKRTILDPFQILLEPMTEELSLQDQLLVRYEVEKVLSDYLIHGYPSWPSTISVIFVAVARILAYTPVPVSTGSSTTATSSYSGSLFLLDGIVYYDDASIDIPSSDDLLPLVAQALNNNNNNNALILALQQHFPSVTSVHLTQGESVSSSTASVAPTVMTPPPPSRAPTVKPTTASPTVSPTTAPSPTTTAPPTVATLTVSPTEGPTDAPSPNPTIAPTRPPTAAPLLPEPSTVAPSSSSITVPLVPPKDSSTTTSPVGSSSPSPSSSPTAAAAAAASPKPGVTAADPQLAANDDNAASAGVVVGSVVGGLVLLLLAMAMVVAAKRRSTIMDKPPPIQLRNEDDNDVDDADGTMLEKCPKAVVMEAPSPTKTHDVTSSTAELEAAIRDLSGGTDHQNHHPTDPYNLEEQLQQQQQVEDTDQDDTEGDSSVKGGGMGVLGVLGGFGMGFGASKAFASTIIKPKTEYDSPPHLAMSDESGAEDSSVEPETEGAMTSERRLLEHHQISSSSSSDPPQHLPAAHPLTRHSARNASFFRAFWHRQTTTASPTPEASIGSNSLGDYSASGGMVQSVESFEQQRRQHPSGMLRKDLLESPDLSSSPSPRSLADYRTGQALAAAAADEERYNCVLVATDVSAATLAMQPREDDDDEEEENGTARSPKRHANPSSSAASSREVQDEGAGLLGVFNTFWGKHQNGTQQQQQQPTTVAGRPSNLLGETTDDDSIFDNIVEDWDPDDDTTTTGNQSDLESNPDGGYYGANGSKHDEKSLLDNNNSSSKHHESYKLQRLRTPPRPLQSTAILPETRWPKNDESSSISAADSVLGHYVAPDEYVL